MRRDERWNGNVKGALWMLASAFAFTLMVTFVKLLADRYSPPQQIFYRQVAGLLVLAPFLIGRGSGVFKTDRPGILFIRAALGTVALMLANYAYQELPLAQANALSFTRALWMAPLGALLLSEKIGWVRVGATLVGFVGVLVAVGIEPLAPGTLWPALASLASALLYAFTVTGAKVMTRDHSVMTIVAWSSVLGVLFAFPPAALDWRWPMGGDLILIFAMGALGVASQTFYMRGLRRGEASAVVPVDYTRLLFAILLGYLLFGELPTWSAVAGGLIIAASAIYLTWREQRGGRQAAPESSES